MTVIQKTDIVDLDTRIILSYGAKYTPNRFARHRVETNLKIAELALPVLRDTLVS